MAIRQPRASVTLHSPRQSLTFSVEFIALCSVEFYCFVYTEGVMQPLMAMSQSNQHYLYQHFSYCKNYYYYAIVAV